MTRLLIRLDGRPAARSTMASSNARVDTPVAINNDTDSLEETTVDLSAILTGGTYDTATICGPRLTARCPIRGSANPTLTLPDVNQNTNATVTLTVTVNGTGANAADGT